MNSKEVRGSLRHLPTDQLQGHRIIPKKRKIEIIHKPICSPHSKYQTDQHYSFICSHPVTAVQTDLNLYGCLVHGADPVLASSSRDRCCSGNIRVKRCRKNVRFLTLSIALLKFTWLPESYGLICKKWQTLDLAHPLTPKIVCVAVRWESFCTLQLQ